MSFRDCDQLRITDYVLAKIWDVLQNYQGNLTNHLWWVTFANIQKPGWGQWASPEARELYLKEVFQEFQVRDTGPLYLHSYKFLPSTPIPHPSFIRSVDLINLLSLVCILIHKTGILVVSNLCRGVKIKQGNACKVPRSTWFIGCSQYILAITVTTHWLSASC